MMENFFILSNYSLRFLHKYSESEKDADKINDWKLFNLPELEASFDFIYCVLLFSNAEVWKALASKCFSHIHSMMYSAKNLCLPPNSGVYFPDTAKVPFYDFIS